MHCKHPIKSCTPIDDVRYGNVRLSRCNVCGKIVCDDQRDKQKFFRASFSAWIWKTAAILCLLILPLPGSAEKVVLAWDWPENATMTYVQGVHIYFGLNGTDGVLNHKKHTVHGTGNQTVINIPGGRDVIIYATSWGRDGLTKLESNASEPLHHNTNTTLETLVPVGGSSSMPAGGSSRIK